MPMTHRLARRARAGAGRAAVGGRPREGSRFSGRPSESMSRRRPGRPRPGQLPLQPRLDVAVGLKVSRAGTPTATGRRCTRAGPTKSGQPPHRRAWQASSDIPHSRQANGSGGSARPDGSCIGGESGGQPTSGCRGHALDDSDDGPRCPRPLVAHAVLLLVDVGHTRFGAAACSSSLPLDMRVSLVGRARWVAVRSRTPQPARSFRGRPASRRCRGPAFRVVRACPRCGARRGRPAERRRARGRLTVRRFG